MDPSVQWAAGAAVFGYLVGSAPFGLILTRLAGLGDLRSIGSGNIGATNVLRTGHRGLAAATLLLDGGKGALAVILTDLLTGGLMTGSGVDDPGSAGAAALSGLGPLAAGTGAVIGHSFPVWLGFRGGKGVATTLGTLLAAVWPVGLAACAVWLATAAAFRISSLAALVAVGTSPLVAWTVAGPAETLFTLLIAALVFGRHHANIARLWRGEESRIRLGGGRTEQPPEA